MRPAAAAVLLLSLLAPARADACGGFFCNQQPVDQQAERIIFAVDDTGTTMIVQIGYTGAPEDFAWILPVRDVPARDSLGTFPAAAIQALDVNTAPMFFRPPDPECAENILLNGGGSDESTPGVTVHIDEVVGPYDVAVIEGESVDPLLTWLGEHDYRVGAAMRPVIGQYVSEGMKLLALRLDPGRGTSDVEPFRMRLPAGAPSIPIRLTAIAAEPEMGFLVFIFGDERWGPANWSELDIDPATLHYGSHTWPAETDWLRRVAEDADAEGGRGWAIEMAGPTDTLEEQVRAVVPSDPDQAAARDALLELVASHPYLTRLYARLSPDEMTLDPIFSPRGGPDVPRDRTMARFVDGVDQCNPMAPIDPCVFTACGPGATCSPVTFETYPTERPGCACPAGTSARTTIDPRGQAVVACQRVTSFLTPAEIGGDPCAGMDCGRGTCVPINAVPTCECEDGMVAVGWIREGARMTRCVLPEATIPADLIGSPELPVLLDGGTVLPPGDAGGPPGGFAPSGGGCSGCSVPADAGGTVPGGLVLILGLVALALARRRGA